MRSAAVSSPATIERSQVTRIVRSSSGSPRYALELFDELLQNGQTTDVPATARAAAASLSHALPSDAAQLLQVAAVIGRRVRDRWLVALSEESEERVADILRLAVERRVLAEVNADSGIYVFCDRALRRALRSELVWSKRRLLHARIAETLSTMADPEQDAPLIADHWDRAQDFEKAAERLPRAARYLTSTNDLDGAAQLYLRAISNVRETSGEWLSLHDEAASCLEELGRHESAIPIREAMLQRERTGDHRITANVLLALMTDYWWTGRFGKYEETVEHLRSFRCAEPSLSWPGRIRRASLTTRRWPGIWYRTRWWRVETRPSS